MTSQWFQVQIFTRCEDMDQHFLSMLTALDGIGDDSVYSTHGFYIYCDS